MKCCNDLIGIKNLCESEETLYYLDDVGISLKTVAKGTDERYANAKEMVNRAISLAWKEVFKDVRIKGQKLDKILFNGESGYFNNTLSTFLENSETIKVSTKCKLAEMTVNCFDLSGEGQATVNFYSDGVLIKTWEDFEFDGTHNFEVYADGKEITIEIIGDVELYEIDNLFSSYVENGLKYAQLDYVVKCSPKNHLCIFAKDLAPAALYKAAAIIWKNIKDGNRWNEFIELKRGADDAVTELAWLDSSYNLLKYDPAATEQYKPKGMYQLELEKIDIPEPKGCKCCLECKGDKMIFSIP